jgi:uncharacterized protein (TIGR02099 family)
MKILIKSLLALIATSALLVFGAVGFFYGWVVPNMDDLRPRIERYLSDKTNQGVRIGRITALSSGFLPSFDLQDVELFNSDQTPLLKLGRVQVAFSALSLMTLEVNRLTIDAPVVAITRDAAGQITIAGFKLSPEAKPSKISEWLFSQKEIAIRGGTVLWRDAMPHLFGTADSLPSATLQNVDLLLANGLRSHDFDFKATPPNAFGQSIEVAAKFTQPLLEQNAGHWQVWTGTINAKIDNIPSLAQSLKTSFDWPLRGLKLEGEQLQLTKLSQIAQSLGQPVPEAVTAQATYLALESTQIERFKLHAKDIDSDKLDLRLDAKATHADFAGDLAVTWKKDGDKIDAKANFERLDLAALQRYVPAQAPPDLRPMLQSVIQKGTASDVRVALKGVFKDLLHINNKAVDLRLSGKVADAELSIPHILGSSSGAAKTPWSNLANTHFNFDFNGTRLELKNIATELPDLRAKGTALIADIKKPVLEVTADLAGRMAAAIAILKTEPLKSLTKDLLLTSSGTGDITSNLQLKLPLAAPAQSKVTGSLQLQGNDIVLNNNVPALANVRGKINFTEAGFQLNGLDANLFGGEVKVSGNAQKITGSGTLTADSLVASSFMPMRATLANRIKGKTAYSFSVEPSPGGSGLIIESNLVGVQIDLPAPLDKPAAANWPLRVQQLKTSTFQDRLAVSLSHLVRAEFVRDTSGSSAKPAVVQRGSIMLASNPNDTSELVLPDKGVTAMLRLQLLDVSAWIPVLGLDKQQAAQSVPTAEASSYVPNQIAAQLDTLRMADRSFSQVVLGASQAGTTWRVNANANDFNGYGEYRQTLGDQAGQIYLRLAKLLLPDSKSKMQIEQLLQAAPERIPALDITVDDFEVTGKKVGSLELVAINQRSPSFLGAGPAQEWRVQKLAITNPDATLKANGAWLPSTEGSSIANRSRRVDLQFSLDIADSGQMLERFGSIGTLKAGKGTMQGRVAWVGSPWSIHFPTLAGQVKLDMSKGQFLKIEPGTAGRFMNVLSLQALPRLLTLDFRDVFSDGFAFDSLGGDAQIANGILTTQNLQMKSVLALVSIDGSVDIARETQNLRVLVLPDINAGGASLIATLINPVIGAATYLAQLILRRPVIAAATKEYSIQGTWIEPAITQTKRTNLPPSPPATAQPTDPAQ